MRVGLETLKIEPLPCRKIDITNDFWTLSAGNNFLTNEECTEMGVTVRLCQKKNETRYYILQWGNIFFAHFKNNACVINLPIHIGAYIDEPDILVSYFKIRNSLKHSTSRTMATRLFTGGRDSERIKFQSRIIFF